MRSQSRQSPIRFALIASNNFVVIVAPAIPRGVAGWLQVFAGNCVASAFLPRRVVLLFN